MQISGFTFIRNGNKFHYPFLESIQSILPVCDEMIVAVGKSDDGTREAIASLVSPKIKIIDTVWDDSLRTGGKIFAQQTNIAFDSITGDWGFYIQSDEVVHENDLEKIHAAAEKNSRDERVDGILFSWIHFYGNYNYVKINSRGSYPLEIRLIRNNKLIRSFRDAQGFRKYKTLDQYRTHEESGEKLRVKKVDANIYHYSKVRGPKLELERVRDFNRYWHSDEEVNKMFSDRSEFEYINSGKQALFEGSHPRVMEERIAKYNWEYKYSPSNVKTPFKHKLLNLIERKTGKRLFDHRNYKLIH